MRITGNRMIDLAAASTARTQNEVGRVSNEVSSGMRVAKPSDDPTAWAAAERAKLHRTLSQGTVSAVAASRDRLDETDAALSTIGDSVSAIRTLAVQGASSTYNAEDRAALAENVRSLMASALGAANARSTDGEYLLAGTASLTQPFDAAGVYTGNATARSIPIGEGANAVATVTGAELTSAAGVDVFPLLDRVANALAANDPVALAATLGELETATKQVGLARTRVGGAMNVLDDTKLAHAALQENLSREISGRVEADTVASASALAKASQALEVSRAVTSHVIAMLDPK
jgi:flagellar hook-associated protein 3 FlgL